MVTYLFYFFLTYLLYQLIFKFIIPIYRTTKKVKSSFRDMQERMNGHVNANGSAKASPSARTPNTKKAEDYIEFEEVKE